MAILDALTGNGDGGLAEIADDAGTTGVQDIVVSDNNVCELVMAGRAGVNVSPFVKAVR